MYKALVLILCTRSKFSQGVRSGNDLADTAIRALEGGALAYNGNPSKSTLIIHSVQRVSYAYIILYVIMHSFGLAELFVET